MAVVKLRLVFQPVFKDLEKQFREATEAYEKTKKNIVGESMG